MSEIFRAATHAMGTRFEIVLSGADPVRLRSVAEGAIAEIEERHRRWSAFQRDSWLSFINSTAMERAITLDDESLQLFELCDEVHRRSRGAFDVTVAPLMEAWGFHGESAGSSDGPVGWGGVTLDSDTRTLGLEPGTRLDLGAIAKGDALDHAAALVKDEGIPRALIHGGTSTVVAIGSPPDRDGWQVRLGDLDSCSVTLRDAVMSISEPRGRTVAGNGHIIDPTRRAPATGIRLACVLCGLEAQSAARSDAWSTALVVLGQRTNDTPEELTTLVVADGEDSCFPSGPLAHCFQLKGFPRDFQQNSTPELIEESR